MTGVRQQPDGVKASSPRASSYCICAGAHARRKSKVECDGLASAVSITQLGIQASVEVSTLLFEVLKVPETAFDDGSAVHTTWSKRNQAVACAMTQGPRPWCSAGR